MFHYDGNNIGSREIIAQIEEFNHAIRLIQNPAIRNAVKLRLVDNVFARYLSVYQIFRDHDSRWLNQTSEDQRGNKYLGNQRQALANLFILNEKVDELLEGNPGLYDLSSRVREQHRLLEKSIILSENSLNRTYTNKVLQAIEVGALVATFLGVMVTGAGALIYGIGYFTCSCAAAAVGAATAKTGGAIVGTGLFSTALAEVGVKTTDRDTEDLRRLNL